MMYSGSLKALIHLTGLTKVRCCHWFDTFGVGITVDVIW